MNSRAFFVRGASILLPEGIPDSQIDQGVSFELQREFWQLKLPAEQFDIPAINGTGKNISCVSVPAECPLPVNWRDVPLRQALSLLSNCLIEGNNSSAGRLLRAFHIAQWRRESLFCGSCGSRNTDAPGETARLCPRCGRLEFPRIAPAVITLIINDEGKALLAHNKKFTPGVYSLIAGFNEAGESLEATVARETLEEVNIKICDIRYVASQPWPFPHSLMAGFSARYASGMIKPDGIEIEDAQWFSRDALPVLPGTGSVSRYLIGRWLAGALL